MIDTTIPCQIGARVAGRWIHDPQHGTPVRDPATGDILARVPDVAAETALAIASAAAATPAPPAQRRDWLLRTAAAITAAADDFARVITLENGKSLSDAHGEVAYAASFFTDQAERLERLEPEALPGTVRDCQWTIRRRPIGVAGLIVPWNFPLAMLAKKLAPCLAAGARAVIKPAPATPLSTLMLLRALDDAGVPADHVHVLTGDAATIGRALCESPAVRLISFTGSTAVGRLLAAQAAPTVTRMSLELGGNAPFVICEDVDVDATVKGLIANKLRGAGQTCVCANRILVHERVQDAVAEALAEQLTDLRLGHGLAPATDLGPLINRQAWDKVRRHETDALAHGARRLFGVVSERPASDWAAYYAPVVLADCGPSMALWREETFGPLFALCPFRDDTDAIRLANDTDYGLAGYVFSGDPARAARIGAALDVGHLGVNTGTGPAPHAPFGGLKQSGYGHEGGDAGLDEFCDLQVVATPHTQDTP